MSISKSSHIHKTIIKSVGIVSFATFCSRILGFVRDIIIARLFGVYVYAQAFVIAFKIPNLFRDLVGEGAANAAFVPVFSEYLQKGKKDEFWQLTNVILNLLLVVLTGLSLFGVLFAPVIVRIVAPGFMADPEKLKTTILLTRILFPYILLISLSSYAAAMLNSLKHFALPAFTPCLLNISIIVFALIYGESIKGLSLGVLIGGILQLAVQIPLLYKKGFRLEGFLRNFKHPAAKVIAKLMAPRLFSSCIYQLNNFVDSFFGSMALIVGEGAVAGLYFAYRLIQFPIGIFSNALSQVILPTFSTQALEDTTENIKRTLSFGLRANFFVMLPASVIFMVLSGTLISTLFGGGRFDAYSVSMTSKVLFFYSIGLSAYGSTKIIQSCFFALKDTITPAKISFVALVVNIVLNIMLMFPMKVAGLALATSISGINTFIILFILLRKKLGGFNVREIWFSFWRILAASLLMGGVCFYLSQRIYFGNSALNKFLNLIILLSAAFVSYLFFCYILRVKEIRQLWQWIKKK
ncbi:MAG: murein biosynthesis integral membrane protein MurJ [Candidatus Omnitrophota bacterium]